MQPTPPTRRQLYADVRKELKKPTFFVGKTLHNKKLGEHCLQIIRWKATKKGNSSKKSDSK